MKIPSGGGVEMVNSTLVTQVILIPTTRGFATCGELKLPFVTRGKFMVIPSLPLLLKGLQHFLFQFE